MLALALVIALGVAGRAAVPLSHASADSAASSRCGSSGRWWRRRAPALRADRPEPRERVAASRARSQGHASGAGPAPNQPGRAAAAAERRPRRHEPRRATSASAGGAGEPAGVVGAPPRREAGPDRALAGPGAHSARPPGHAAAWTASTSATSRGIPICASWSSPFRPCSRGGERTERAGPRHDVLPRGALRHAPALDPLADALLPAEAADPAPPADRRPPRAGAGSCCAATPSTAASRAGRSRPFWSSGRKPMLGYWPAGHRFAYVLTHDVERAGGLAGIEPLLELEARHGMVSAWFLVGDDYPVESALLDRLRAAGCEVGLHGLHHDGRLFESRQHFERELPGIHRRLREWGADGLPLARRPPQRRLDAGARLQLRLVVPRHGPVRRPARRLLLDPAVLPRTTSWSCRSRSPTTSRSSSSCARPTSPSGGRRPAWIADHGGLVNVLVHPDYARTPERLRHYEELLQFLAELPGGWHALPREVATWWRRRSAGG